MGQERSAPGAAAPREWVVRQAGAAPAAAPAAPFRSLEVHLDFAVIPVDKASGPTSHDVVDAVRRARGAARAGHGGTLDPNACGVLPVFLGRATRVSSMLLEGGKEYEAEALLHGDVGRPALETGLERFRGEIRQLPPVRSRVKREWRSRTVYELDLLSHEGRTTRLRVSCEAGTYVRKLVHDLGQALGCGAHMTGLKRTRAGIFRIEQAASLEALGRAAGRAREGDEAELRRFAFPAEVLADRIPRMVADRGAIGAIAAGIPLRIPGVLAFEAPFEAGDALALLSPSGDWLAIGEAALSSVGLAAASRGTAARIKRQLFGVGPPQSLDK
ncbi:MAG: RNA-guided pseudouridylation complex pseudouridine synthase subunit Cbf5 [Planctomycetes bacterium]|nr:RNA-guided pseudouridylation complex pseudouridine synthase subunit Cbf5 [Planctomycetota bacterium]